MKTIALEFMYHTDLISVPDDICDDIKKVERAFDKWLYDKSNDHSLWICENGIKRAVSFDTSDFVNYLNDHPLSGRRDKSEIIEENAKEIPDGVPVLYF
ncbi:MAG: hypothetical protein IJR90_06165 [Clostridia bacterium]|nr:hypothetical protein [Clostridia bacterium]